MTCPSFRPPFRPTAVLAAVLALMATSPLSVAQPIIPNPLIQPAAQVAAAAASAAAAQPSAAPLPRGQGRQQAASARQADPQDPALSEEPKPAGIPSAVLERVSGLYVAAIVDKAAILRSQLAVPQVVFASGAGPAIVPVTGSSGGGSSSSGGGSPQGGAAAQPSGGTPGGSQGPSAVYRAPSYIVRDGQVVDFVDVHQVVARVTRDTVVLYLLAEAGAPDRRARVVFRGTIDSVIASPPAPSRATLETPDGGLDGRARRDLTNVDNRGSLASGRNAGVTPAGSGSSSGSTGTVR